MKTKAPLTATKVANAKEGTHADTLGLSLVVTATCKSWRFKYYQPITKKRQNIRFFAGSWGSGS
ncbi:Arm DNA-binding domain-containing protein [Aeromonas sp. QDB06]|uniref:Arm DNA-binding domain-containing protein n=1 Tax=unclassified Aeromonas TaxID=257493 RepID=UPI003FA43E7B